MKKNDENERDWRWRWRLVSIFLRTYLFSLTCFSVPCFPAYWLFIRLINDLSPLQLKTKRKFHIITLLDAKTKQKPNQIKSEDQVSYFRLNLKIVTVWELIEWSTQIELMQNVMHAKSINVAKPCLEDWGWRKRGNHSVNVIICYEISELCII